MTRAFLFWLVYIIAVLAYLGVIFWWSDGPGPYAWRSGAPGLISMILIGLLGWGVYGTPIKG